MSAVFLSHSHADKAFARRLAADLRAAGHSVWIDEAEINVGDSLVGKIREGIDQVDYVAAILSEASISSEWVTRELDIASNREIEEKRVMVLPLLVQKVELPGFLKGKFYADFTSDDKYLEQFNLLLRALGPAEPVPMVSPEELASLRQELEQAKASLDQHREQMETHRRFALRGKSEKLRSAIESENKGFPRHAPINDTYAFEVGKDDGDGGIPVTLGYLLHAIRKAQMKGAHPLDILISLENKWDLVESMLGAYSDMVESAAN